MNDCERHLCDRVDQAIATSPHLMRHKLGLETDSGVVVLTGTVDTYFQKQMAQETVRRVDGVQLVDNRLEVQWT